MHAPYDRIPSPASSPYTCSLQSRSRNYWWRTCTHTYTVSLSAILSYTVCMGGWLSVYRVSYLSHSSRTSLAVSSASYSVSCTLFSIAVHVCMYVCKPVWIVAMGNGFSVYRCPLGWSLVRIASHAAVLPCTIYRRATSARTEPYPTLLYPDLTYPAVLLYLCVCCVSLLCVSDLTYLSPFVSLSLCLSVIVGGVHGPPYCSL